MHCKPKLWLKECSLLRECCHKKAHFSSLLKMAMMTSLSLSNCDVTNNSLANQGGAFYTLSKNIFLVQPARAEILFTPSKNIKFFWPIRREFFKPSQGIFSSFSQPGQKNFSHLQKILNSFGQSGESFYTPSQRIFYSSSQSGQKYF